MSSTITHVSIMNHRKKTKKGALQDMISSNKTVNVVNSRNVVRNTKPESNHVSPKVTRQQCGLLTKPLVCYPKARDASSNWKALKETLKLNESPKKKKDNSNILKKSPSRRMLEKKLDSTEKTSRKKLEVWFDGVDKNLLETTSNAPEPTQKAGQTEGLVKEGSFDKPTKIIAMDCEMVGVGPNGQDSVLARISIVNVMGNCIYDKFVKPLEDVVDYRTAISGIRREDLEKGEDFEVVQKEVNKLLEGRILVGHAVHHDLKVLFLSHPKKRIRDTSTFKIFRSMFGGRTPSLKRLCEQVLGVKVQQGEHSSVQDAQAAMRLYTMYRRQWERMIAAKRKSTKAEVASA